MSTFKKVISLVLCLSMLTGVFAVLGAPIASAAVGDDLSKVLPTPTLKKVKTVADLNKNYSNGYFYLGLEFYEYGADGKSTTLSDGYVTAGQTLQVRFYMKSSFYFNAATIHYAFDRNFFDISNGLTGITEDTTGNNGNNAISTASKPTDIKYPTEGTASAKKYYVANNAVTNSDYVVKGTSETQIKANHATVWAGNEGSYFTDATSSAAAKSSLYDDELPTTGQAMVRGWDLYELTNVTRKTSGAGYVKIDSDKHFWSFDVKVRGDLADGTTGSSILRTDMFKVYDRFANNKTKNAYRKNQVTLHTASGTSGAQELYAFTAITENNFLIDDCNQTLVVGTNPAEAGKYAAVFVGPDNKVVAEMSSDAGEMVTPPVVTKENSNFLGWVNLRNEKLEINPTADGTSANPFKMPESNVSYKAVFDTDKFKVTFDLDGGTIEGGSTTYAKDVAYGETIDLKDLTSKVTKEHKTLATWNIDGIPCGDTYKHETLEDVTIKATWNDTKYTFTFMVKDYTTGQWKEYTKLEGYYNDGEYTNVKTAVANKVKPADIGWSGTLFSATVSASETGGEAVTRVQFTKDMTYYIHTRVSYNVTVKIPEYDTGNNQYKEDTYVTIYSANVNATQDDTGVVELSLNSNAALIKDLKNGFEFDTWTDDNSRTVAITDKDPVKITVLPPANHTSIVITGSFKPYEYQVGFYTQNISKVLYTLPVKVGEEIDLTKGELKYMADKETPVATYKFPVEGVESSQQADGAKNWAPAGYRFDGWYLTNDASQQTEATKLTFPLEITQSMVARTNPITMNPLNFDSTKKTLMFYPKWTAIEYPVNFYITNAANEKELYTTMNISVGKNISTYINTVSTAEERAKINARAPEGKTFSIWQAESAYVLAGGMDVVAQYTDTTFAIYIDLNNGREGSKPSSYGNAVYGTDPEFESEDGTVLGAGMAIRKKPMYDNDKPIGNYEIIGWKVFYLEDPADINSPEKWKEGYSPNGERKAYAPIVYQAQWISHDDLLFRTYDTAGNLYSVLSKDFKRYYWSNNTSCDKSAASINAFPDTQFVAFITPSLENFEWSGFFSADMWSKVSLRFDAKGLANDTFSPENIAALIRLLISLIKGEEELPEM